MRPSREAAELVLAGIKEPPGGDLEATARLRNIKAYLCLQGQSEGFWGQPIIEQEEGQRWPQYLDTGCWAPQVVSPMGPWDEVYPGGGY